MGEKSQRTIAEIERDLAATRGDLLATVHELEDALLDQLDWRHHVRARPLLWLGGCFALGFLLGSRRHR